MDHRDSRIEEALRRTRLSPHASLHLLEAAALVLDWACPGVTVDILGNECAPTVDYLVDCANRHTISARIVVGRLTYFLRATCYRGKGTCEIQLSKGAVSSGDLLDLSRTLNELANFGEILRHTMTRSYARERLTRFEIALSEMPGEWHRSG